MPASARAAIQELDDDARLPAHGEIWVEVHPAFESWHEQFARSSPLGVSDGDPEPLTADLDGEIAARLFPGLAPLVADLNRDAGALGFDPITEADLSLGSLDFGSIDAEVRRLPLVIRLGLLERLSLELFAPITRTEVETSFVFDSIAATLVATRSAVPDPTGFFASLEAEVAGLQILIDSGSLSPEEEAAARELVEDAGAFGGALSARVNAGALIPRGGTAAGSQIAARYAALETGFAGFGFQLPVLQIPSAATSTDLQAYFGGPPLAAEVPGDGTRSWTLGEIELGLKVKVLDTFGRPRRAARSVPPRDTAAARLAPDTAAAPDTADAEQERPRPSAGEGDDAPQPGPPTLDRPGGLRFRAALGIRLRLPLRAADRSPFLAPGDFLGIPAGDGQRDVEASWYQELQLARPLLVVAVVRRGFQLSDELTRRVAPPDRPFAVVSTASIVERNLGDYWSVRLSPRLQVNDVVSFGLEYSLWRKGGDVYRIVSAGPDAPDSTPLESETEETRHRLGIGVFYRTTDRVRAGIARLPVEMHLTFQTAVAGSGGQTAVSSFISTGLRVPLSLF